MFQHNRDKVKVTVAVRRKLFSLFWPSHLENDFNITTQMLSLNISLIGSCFRGL